MSAYDVTGAHILVVDDSPINLSLLSGILGERGYRVTAADSGPRALAAAQSEPVDLVMLDINMPDMDGYEVCEALKADEATEATPVIFISALDDAMDKVKAFNVGGSDYIVKPFQRAEVLARVENQLRLKRLQRDMEAKNVELTRKNEEILRATEEIVASTKAASSAFSALAHVLPEKVLDGRYKLDTLIGRGGYGAVFRATHLVLNRQVAIKVLLPTADPGPQEMERFRLEGVVACRVHHPNAVAVWDGGMTPEGIAYLVMELLEGRTLRAELLEKRKLSVRRCAEILEPVCAVLAVAHAGGVVHRDIKPDNIFLHRERDREVVKVVDFGIATLMRDSSPLGGRFRTPGTPIGTPAYIAPERFEVKPYGGGADIYSLGVMLYEMLCGDVPFESPAESPWVVAHQHLTKAPRPLRERDPSIPAGVEAAVLRALEKNPAKRPSAAELAESFLQAVEREGGENQ